MHPLLVPLVVLAVLWLVLLTATGFLASTPVTGHGSIALPPLGLALGVLGGLVHTVLCTLPRFRRLSLALQALFVWFTAEAALFTFVTVFLAFEPTASIRSTLGSALSSVAVASVPLALGVALLAPLARYGFGLGKNAA